MASKKVQEAIRTLLERGEGFSSGELSKLTGTSRQALHRHLSRALDEGWLVREGRGRATRYKSGVSGVFERTYPTANLSEDSVVCEFDGWLDEECPTRSEGADEILRYAVSELVNNAIEHSGAASVRVRAAKDAGSIRVWIADSGIGAFELLRSHLDLDDHLHALQQLMLGKVTSDPEHHTGEGIFFTSKMVDSFELVANGLAWIVDATLLDQAVREVDPKPGTALEIRISAATQTTAEGIFRNYTHDFEFDTTCCVVRLFEYGTRFVSRSEAKRLVKDLDRFREVLLDFSGVTGVGQGFVDQIFRVWARAHPEVRLLPREMNAAVEFMVCRGTPRGPEHGGGRSSLRRSSGPDWME